MHDFLTEALELFAYTQGMRRDFHRYPELGFQEVRTAGIVAEELNNFGLEVRTGIAETGVVAILNGARPGPVILLRFDMDALPILEQTGKTYASQNPGVMHACGHDGHVAVGLTVARILHAHQKDLTGVVKFVFQPAEEGLGGAERMVAEGVLENPKPDAALAMHFWNEQPVGWIGVSPGPVMAASDEFTVRIIGKGGHGAAPHLSVDPVVASAQIISALQSIVSRNVPPLKSAVISVTAIHGGEAFNVIPADVILKGTIRTFDPPVRQDVLRRFYQLVKDVAGAMDCGVEIDVQLLTPALINDPQIANRVREVAQATLPDDQVGSDFRTMMSEDMAFMMEKVPGCYFFVGSANAEKGLDAPHHHPRFDFDEAGLLRATALMTAITMDLLR